MSADISANEAAPARTGAREEAGGRRLGLALLVISMAQLMLVLDELVVNTALPHVQQALHFSGTGLEWVVTSYAVTFGGLLLLGGRSGDILGRRRMFITGLVVFSLSSLLGGLATRSSLLITARTLQGIGAAIAAPAALSLITVTFPEGKQRTRALGVYAAMTGLGGGVGLLAGGLLTTYASWRWVFFVNVPVGALVTLGALTVLPESQRHPHRWDLPGAITGTAGFALLIYGLTRGATGPDGISHWGDSATITALTGAAVVLAAFVAIEARAAQPLLPLWIFASRNRTGVYLILLCLAASWTVINHHIRNSAHALAGAGPAAAHRAITQPGNPLYDQALAAGVRTALTIGAGATVLALIVALIAIRVRKEDLPGSPTAT